MAKIMMDLEEIKAKATARLMESAARAARKGNLEKAARLVEGARFLEQEIEDPFKRVVR